MKLRYILNGVTSKTSLNNFKFAIFGAILRNFAQLTLIWACRGGFELTELVEIAVKGGECSELFQSKVEQFYPKFT